MKRDLSDIASREYDLVIVGGGVFGIFAAWDATLRGLSVALLERADFAAAASANCFKMIHGGIRYMQHGDLIRLRQSTAERSALLRIAPHLARPLPIFIPTYGHGMKGKEILATGMKVYDLLTADRNRGIPDPSRRIPNTHTMSRAEALSLYPFLDRAGFTGGAIFHDGQMYSPARLALCALISATKRGAVCANYAEVTELLRAGDTAVGVRVRDTLNDSEFEVRGRAVLNASGGWAPDLLARSLPQGLTPRPTFSRDAYFLIRRPIPGPYALAVSGSTKDPDAIMSRDARHLFLVPWRGGTLVGVWHKVWTEDPNKVGIPEEDLAGFLAEINESCPWLELGREEVALTQCGLVLFGENSAGASDLSYGKRSLLVDHERVDGTKGLLTLVGVRYTTARAEADRAIRAVCAKLGRKAPRSQTAQLRIHGGAVDDFQGFEADAQRGRPSEVSAESLSALVRNHGSELGSVMALGHENAAWLQTLPGTQTLAAEVVKAVREEMAVRLEDVVFGRTDLGTQGHPGAPALEAAASIMAEELGWDDSRRSKELERSTAAFPAAPAARVEVSEGR